MNEHDTGLSASVNAGDRRRMGEASGALLAEPLERLLACCDLFGVVAQRAETHSHGRDFDARMCGLSRRDRLSEQGQRGSGFGPELLGRGQDHLRPSREDGVAGIDVSSHQRP